ncbi:Uncharacterised protein [Salmonella enterica subsp. enterica]|uniref:Uncharacterized protein n=1 Tax=Salmonella enterica I TaxID=59201 RepID=A0A379WH81_SALET|nr:Uncharacterised protein [Salmonella enterica subsp. enterica]
MVDVTVVARIEHRGGHEAVNEQRAALFVNFVFDRICVSRDLDNDVDIFRQFLPAGTLSKLMSVSFEFMTNKWRVL